MQAGDMRARVGFYPRTEERNGAGGTQGGFEEKPQYECAAKIKPRLGGEQVVADRLQGQVTVNITVRSCAASRRVDVDWMLKDQRAGTVYNIKSIIDPYQSTARAGQWLEMLCQSGAPA